MSKLFYQPNNMMEFNIEEQSFYKTENINMYTITIDPFICCCVIA